MKRSNNYGILKTVSLTDASDMLSSKGEEARRERMDELNTKAGYPESQDVEEIRNTKVLEIDSLDEDGTNPHPKFPGQVNESGEEVGTYIDDEGKDVTKAFMKYLMKDAMKSNKYWKKPAKNKPAKTPSKSERFDVRSTGQAATEKYHTPSERHNKRMDTINRGWATNKEKADKENAAKFAEDFPDMANLLDSLKNAPTPEKMMKAERPNRYGTAKVDHSVRQQDEITGATGDALARHGLGSKGKTWEQQGQNYEDKLSSQLEDPAAHYVANDPRQKSMDKAIVKAFSKYFMKTEYEDGVQSSPDYQAWKQTVSEKPAKESFHRRTADHDWSTGSPSLQPHDIDQLEEYKERYPKLFAMYNEDTHPNALAVIGQALENNPEEWEQVYQGLPEDSHKYKLPPMEKASHDKDDKLVWTSVGRDDSPIKPRKRGADYGTLFRGRGDDQPELTPSEKQTRREMSSRSTSMKAVEKGLGDVARKLTGKRDIYEDIASVMANNPEEFANVDMESYRKKALKDVNEAAAKKGVTLPESFQNSILKAYSKYFMLEKKAKKYKNIKDKIKSKDPKHWQQAYEQLKPREDAFFSTSPKAKHVAAMDAHKAEHGQFPWDAETES